MKAWYGDAATTENDFCYDWLPKKDAAYDVLAMFERMHQGKMNGFVCQGFNPLASVPNKKKVGDALAKLKYLVVMDPLATETSEFWKNYGEFNDCRSGQDPDRGVPPAGRPASPRRPAPSPIPAASCSGTGRRRTAGRSEGRHRNHGRAVPEAEGDVRQGWRRVPRPDAQPDLAVPHCRQARRRRNC